MARKRLGELLLERGIITREQLEQALSHHRQTGQRLGASMVTLKILTELQLASALGAALGLKAVRMPPEPAQVDRAAVSLLKARFCEANDLFPVALDVSQPNRKTLLVAMADPLNIPAIEEMEFTTGMKVVPLVAPLSGVRAAVLRYCFRRVDEPDNRSGASDEMTIQRSGGRESVVSTGTGRRPVAPLVQPREGDELPLVQAEPYREVTERTALADLIRDRVERKQRRPPRTSVDDDLDFLFGQADTATDSLQKLEVRFWALLRIMAKKGLITRDEFLNELAGKDD